jgi:hypothetical protein
VTDLPRSRAGAPSAPKSASELEAEWLLRRAFWARKLGRLRIGVEPIEEQLTRHRRVTWMLTAVPGLLSIALFSLFAAFKRPDIGVCVAALLFVPIAAGAWLGEFLRDRRGRAYLAEWAEYERAKAAIQSGGASRGESAK